jgi:hypothetical protein
MQENIDTDETLHAQNTAGMAMSGDLEACRAAASPQSAAGQGGRENGAPLIAGDEFRQFAFGCRVMGLATNNPEWDGLAERWLRCADWFDRPLAAAEERVSGGDGSSMMSQPSDRRAPAAGAQVAVARGGGLIDLLLIRMESLDLEAGEAARIAPAVFRELADACADCECKEGCERDLAYASAGMGGREWEHYCPNAATLRAMSELPWFATIRTE